MTRKRSILAPALACLVACSSADALAAAPTTAPATTPTFDQLLSELHHGDWARRQQAEDALVEMGPAVAAQVAEALEKSKDIELKERLRSALSRISREELLLPTIVTIQEKFERPIDAFKALGAKVGLSVSAESPEAEAIAGAARPFEINIEKKPWLEALAEVVAVTNVNVRLDEGKITLHRAPPSSVRRPTSPGGAVSISAESARRRQGIDLSNENRSSSTFMRIGILCEPKIRFRTNTPAMVLNRIVDEKGNSLLTENQRRIPLQRESHGRLVAQFTPSNGLKSPDAVALIEGEIQGEIITRMNDLVVEDLSSLPQSLDAPGGEVIIESLVVGKPNSQLTVQVAQSVMFNRSSQQDLMTAMNTGELRILDQNGEVMRGTISNQQGMNGSISLTYSLSNKNPDARPTRLTWSVPAQTRTVKIPFVLRDLPLPQ